MPAPKTTAPKTTAPKMGAAGEKSIIILDEKYLQEHPELAQQGYTVGDQYEAPIETTKEVTEAKDAGRSKEDEATMSAEPTGRFIVRSFEGGTFRLYNERGQAVSPLVTDAREINRQASRANALNDANKIGPAPKAGPAPTVQ
jgi:hypothetical protein